MSKYFSNKSKSISQIKNISSKNTQTSPINYICSTFTISIFSIFLLDYIHLCGKVSEKHKASPDPYDQKNTYRKILKIYIIIIFTKFSDMRNCLKVNFEEPSEVLFLQNPTIHTLFQLYAILMKLYNY